MQRPFFKFSYKGFTIKDGVLEGLGKLKIGERFLQTEETCLKVNKVSGLNPVEIIGTFANGTLNGNAKIVLQVWTEVLAILDNIFQDVQNQIVVAAA